MADVPISGLPNGDAQVTGSQGRVDVPVTIGTTTYQVDEAKLNTIPPTGAPARAILFTNDAPLVAANGDLFFGSETAGTAGRTNMQVKGPTSGGEIVVDGVGGSEIDLLSDGTNASITISTSAPGGNASLDVETSNTKEATVNVSGGNAGRTSLCMDRTSNALEATAPTLIGTNQMNLYFADRCGRPSAALQPGANYRWTLQPALFARPTAMWRNNISFGFRNPVTGGTLSFANAAVTNRYVSSVRTTYASVVTTLNQALGLTFGGGSEYLMSQGNGMGGFFFHARFGFETYKAGDRLFIGLCSSISLAADPSSATNMVGFAMDAADSAITFMHNDNAGTATKTAIPGQPTVASGQGYDAYIWSDPSDNSKVYYRLDDLNGHTIIADTFVSTDLPQGSVGYVVRLGMSNGANTTAGDATIGITQFYLDTDY